MKMKKLMAALENYQEAPLPAAVVEQAEVGAIDPQPVAIIEQVAPVVEPVVEQLEPVVTEVPVDAIVPTELEIPAPTEFQEHVDALDANVGEQSQLNTHIDEGMVIQNALESYVELLRQAGPDGVSRQTAGFLRVGLEAIHQKGERSPFGRHLDLSAEVASMEDMGEGEKQHLLPSKLDRKAIGKKFMEMIKKVIAYMRDKFGRMKEFAQHLMQGIPFLERKLKKIDAKLGSSKNQGNEFTFAKPERVAVGSNVVPEFPNSLMAVTSLAVDNYPNRMTQFYNAIASTLSNFSPENNNSSEISGMLEKATGVLADLKASEQVLPGNVRIDVSDSGLSYGIAEADSPDVGEVKLKARGAPAVKSDLDKMVTVLGFLKKYPQYQEKMVQAAGKVTSGLERMEKMIEGAETDKTAQEAARGLIAQVNGVLHKANPRGDEIIKYLVRTMSAFSDLYIAELGGKTDGDVGKDVAVQ